jgi:hypothetical protein
MPITLEGSCHCGAVRFSLASHTPHPYQLCYCSICRKTAGGGGFAINIMGVAKTLSVTGRRALRVYRAVICDEDGNNCENSSGERNFCGKCASALWLFDPPMAIVKLLIRLVNRYERRGDSIRLPIVGIGKIEHAAECNLADNTLYPQPIRSAKSVAEPHCANFSRRSYERLDGATSKVRTVADGFLLSRALVKLSIQS